MGLNLIPKQGSLQQSLFADEFFHHCVTVWFPHHLLLYSHRCTRTISTVLAISLCRSRSSSRCCDIAWEVKEHSFSVSAAVRDTSRTLRCPETSCIPSAIPCFQPHSLSVSSHSNTFALLFLKNYSNPRRERALCCTIRI